MPMAISERSVKPYVQDQVAVRSTCRHVCAGCIGLLSQAHPNSKVAQCMPGNVS